MESTRIITRVILICQVMVLVFTDLLMVLVILCAQSCEQVITKPVGAVSVEITLKPPVVNDLRGELRWNQISLRTFSQKRVDATIMVENSDMVMPITGYAIIDLSEQKEYVSTGEDFYVYRVATGSASNLIPSGVWRINKYYSKSELVSFYGPCLLKLEYYDGSSWILTERALHGTNTPAIIGLPESLGCVYHYNDDILEVCGLLKIGDLVIVIE